MNKIILLNFVGFALGIAAFATPKLAIAFLLGQIVNPSAFQKKAIWGLAIFVFVFAEVATAIVFTSCDPNNALWKPDLINTGARCRLTRVIVGLSIFLGGVYWFFFGIFLRY